MRRCNKLGAILPFVLGILLAVTVLLTSLLQMPGSGRQLAMRYLLQQQRIYDAESALLAYLEGIPEGFFEQIPENAGREVVHLPRVSRERMGPWADLRAEVDSCRSVHVLAGVACDSGCSMLRSYSLRHDIYDAFRLQLNREIMMVKPPLELVSKTGNRRVFGQIPSMALRVMDGDLSLDLEGRVSSGRFMVDGAMEVRGSAVFDTLRVYARGPLVFRGQTKVHWLEAFSEDRVEISKGMEFSGVVVALHKVAFPNGTAKVQMRYPSFVMSLESSETLQLDSMFVPDFVVGSLKPFEWKLNIE